MRVLNIHERELNATMDAVGELIDGLASKNDLLWPHDRWPPMRFDRSLGVGAVGGHGPIRYDVDAYEPGRSIRFRFTKPEGFSGSHRFELEPITTDRVRIRHVIELRTSGSSSAKWFFAIRSLHDALLEDALDRAESFVGGPHRERSWSLWVRILRWAMNRARTAGKKSRTT